MRRHAPSIGIGLGLSLRTSIAVFANYFKVGRVLDLFTNFFSSDTSITDQSGEGNDAIPYTGRYVYTDGSNDKAINANCSALGASTYKLTGKIRSTSTGAKVATIGGQAISYTVLAANVWEDFETSVTTSVAPSAVIVGWDGTSTFTGADWSDVRLIDTARSETVIPRWQLNDSAAADLDGYPAIDSGGGGFHGVHDGGSSGSGEGTDADVRELAAYSDYILFDAVDDYVETTGMVSVVDYFGSCTISADIYVGDTSSTQVVWSLGSSAYRLLLVSGEWNLGDGTVTGVSVESGFQNVSVTFNLSGYAISFRIDEIEVWTGTAVSSGSGTSFYLGARLSTTVGLFFNGLIYNFEIADSSVKNFAYTGRGATPFDDTIGSNDGTVSGNPVTVAQKRETILQTAGMDWNKYSWFNGVDNFIGLGVGDPLGFNGVGKIEFSATIYFSELPSGTEDIFYQYISEGSVGFSLDLQASGAIRVSGRSAASDSYESFISSTTLSAGLNTVSAYLDYANDEIGISLNGGAYETAVATFANATFTYEGSVNNTRIGNSQDLARFFTGSISNVTVLKDDVAIDSYTGLGNDPWKDTIGSNNGTESGTFTRQLVPVSDTTPTLDAFGTAIANPRPNAKVLNLFEEGEFVELPDVASLEDVRSITLAVYNDGTTKDILQAAAGASFVDIAANVLQTDQSGTHAYYVGGVATTTLAAGWNIVGITFDAAKDLSGGKMVATSGNLLAYDPNALTLADQLQNSTAFSPSYGL